MKDYKDLSDSTKARLKSFLKKADQSGYTFREMRKMSDSELKTALNLRPNVSKEYLRANRRLINQIQKSKERRVKVIENVKDEYKKLGFRGKRLDLMEKQLIRTAGNTFTAMSDEVRKKYFMFLKDKDKQQRKADIYTKKMLLVPKPLRPRLTKDDQDILDDFSP